jgi:dihydroorotase
MNNFDLILRGGKVVTPSGIIGADIGVTKGRIAEIGDLRGQKSAQEMDAKHFHILPGVIDSQVHFREPGLEHKEDLESGTRGAILGGVTSIFEMPNTNPLTLTKELLEDKLNRAKGRAWCDHAFFIGGSKENYQDLPKLEMLPGCAGVKIFMGSSTGSLLVEDDATLLKILQNGMRRVAVHSEDEARLRERKPIAEKAGHARAHHEWRDVETAMKSTTRLIRLASQAKRRVHVLHITSADEMEFLAQHKDIATVEVTPQHLTFAAPECYERLGSLAQMNPPIRGQEHQDALWHALQNGVVDVLGSDHAPHTREEKQKPYPQSPSGMTGVQTLLPVMLNHVAAGRLTLERLVDLTAHAQQRIFDIADKGRIAVGYDADFAIVDLKMQKTITHNMIASKSAWTPYDGLKVTGFPVMTILRGRVVMRDGQTIDQPQGQPVRFAEAL